MIEEESQAVLNTLTEHYFQDSFRKMAEAYGAYARKGTVRGSTISLPQRWQNNMLTCYNCFVAQETLNPVRIAVLRTHATVPLR
jgi:hypothetical protein